MRNYGYNYDFLAEWLKEHPRMKGQAAKAIGTSPAGINRWLVDIDNPEHRERHCDKHGRVVKPMKLERMIEFCNMLDANLSSFFIDGGEAAEIKPAAAPKHTTLIRSSNQDLTALKLEHAEEKNKLLEEIKKLHEDKEVVIDRTTQTMVEQEHHIMEQQIKINELHQIVLNQQEQLGNQAKMLALYENGHLQPEEKKIKPLIAAEDLKL